MDIQQQGTCTPYAREIASSVLRLCALTCHNRHSASLYNDNQAGRFLIRIQHALAACIFLVLKIIDKWDTWEIKGQGNCFHDWCPNLCIFQFSTLLGKDIEGIRVCYRRWSPALFTGICTFQLRRPRTTVHVNDGLLTTRQRKCTQRRNSWKSLFLIMQVVGWWLCVAFVLKSAQLHANYVILERYVWRIIHGMTFSTDFDECNLYHSFQNVCLTSHTHTHTLIKLCSDAATYSEMCISRVHAFLLWSLDV